MRDPSGRGAYAQLDRPQGQALATTGSTAFGWARSSRGNAESIAFRAVLGPDKNLQLVIVS